MCLCQIDQTNQLTTLWVITLSSFDCIYRTSCSVLKGEDDIHNWDGCLKSNKVKCYESSLWVCVLFPQKIFQTKTTSFVYAKKKKWQWEKSAFSLEVLTSFFSVLSKHTKDAIDSGPRVSVIAFFDP
jgi:hypothetical protein